MNLYKNPILEGFSPDPSICAVGEDFYLVTSTFAYFPGVPIYHSKDLTNWEHIGNILDRPSQLPLEATGHSRGIFAPTIRYHQGTFYMITTNVSYGGNFYVTATNPKGPWSDPVYLPDAPGIDPSLFFDGDRCFYVGTRPNPTGVTYNGDWEVWLQELDLSQGKLIGLPTPIWKGSMVRVEWPEGPHLYKKDEYYYLMIAEGGTSVNHSITIARSKRIDGPYEGFKNNPILTHRHLGKDYPITCVGHGDLVETKDGSWYLTCLACRPYEGYTNLGRETFLAKVEWEDGWPVVNPGQGRLLDSGPLDLPVGEIPQDEQTDLNPSHLQWMFLRNPDMENYQYNPEQDSLNLIPTTITLKDEASPTYMGLRQKAMDYEMTVEVEVHLNEGAAGGLAILQSNLFHAQLLVVADEDGLKGQWIETQNGQDKILASIPLTHTKLRLSLEGSPAGVTPIIYDGDERKVLLKEAPIYYLTTEVAGGFVGCTVGLVATCKDTTSPGSLEIRGLLHRKLNR